MATFPYAYRKVLIGSGAIRTTGSSVNLYPGEIALIDAKTGKALSAAESTYSQHREVLLAQGSYHTKDVLSLGNGGLKESIKSRPIHGHYITNFRLAEPQRPQNQIIAIGYDGVDTTKTITAKPDEDYFLRLDVKGEPIYRFLGRPAYATYHVKAPCGPGPCTDDCDAVADPQFIADSLVEQINSDPYVNPFVKAEKILSCSPAIPDNPNNVAQTLYQLSLCDVGDQSALAAVASQYPDLDVTRVDRDGSISIYEVCVPTADGAPDDYQPDQRRVIPDCATCPTGFTFNAVLYKAEVMREDAGNGAALTAVQSAYAGSVAVRINYEYGTSKYVLYFTSSTYPAAVAGDVFIPLDEVEQSVCVETATPDPIEWASAGTRYKTTRALDLTVSKTCGGANRLTDIRAFYAGVAASLVGGTAGITVKTAGECADVYTVQQYNNECLLDPCGGQDTPSFDTLQSFEGQVWAQEPAPAVPDGTTCAVGIRLTGAYVDTQFGNCSFYPTDNYNLDMVTIVPSQLLENGDRCELGWPVTELQGVKFASGVGETVLRELITFMGYRQEDYFWNPRYRETLDTESWTNAIDRNKFYKIYYLTYNVPYTNNSTNLYNNEQYEIMVAFPEEADTRPFENLINSYTTSVGVQLTAL